MAPADPSPSWPSRSALYLVGLAATLAALGAGMTTLRRRVDWNQAKLEAMQALEPRRLDVLLLGDSEVLQGLSPRVLDAELGTRSFNAALGGSPLVESALRLRWLQRRGVTSRLAVVNIALRDRIRYRQVRPSFRLALGPEERAALAAYRQRTGRATPWVQELAEHLALFRHRSARRSGMRNLLAARWRPIPTPYYRLVEGHVEVLFDLPVAARAPRQGSWVPIQGLRVLGEACQALGVALLLVEMPTHPRWLAGIEGHAEARQALEAALPAGATFVSLADLGAELGPECWMDAHHLSLPGAEAATRALAPHVRRALDTGGPR